MLRFGGDTKSVFPNQSDRPFLPGGTQVELIIKSQDRDQGSDLNDAHFTLIPIVPNVQSISLGWFSFYNLFPNVLATNDDNILGIEGPAGVPATITFQEGRWQSGFGRVTNTLVRADNNNNLNDVRYYLIRSAYGAAVDGSQDAILAVTLDPVNGALTIEWNTLYTGVGPITVDDVQGSMWSQLGFTTTTTTFGSPGGVLWLGVGSLNLGDPISIALSSQTGELSTSNMYQTSSFNPNTNSRTNYFALIPVNAAPNSINYFEPYNPVTFITMRNSRPLIDMRIQISDPVTGQLMHMSSVQQWQCKLILNLNF